MDYFKILKEPLNHESNTTNIAFGIFSLILLVFALFAFVFIVLFAGVIESDLSEVPIATVMIFFLGLLLFVALIYLIFSMFFYEYAKAGIEKREAESIWSLGLGQNISRAVKLFAPGFIYTLPLLLVLGTISILIGVPLNEEATDEEVLVQYMFNFFSNIISFFYLQYVVYPPLLNVIKHDSISKGFSLGEAFKNSVSRKEYNFFVLVQIGILFLFQILFFITGILIFFIIGLCLMIPLFLLNMYYSYIAVPYTLGRIYGKDDVNLSN